MVEILKLIRIKTVLFAAFTMYVIRYFLVEPLLGAHGIPIQMSNGDFLLLVLSVCFLLSAAYAINDYFDTKLDRLSGERRVIVGKSFTRRSTIFLHSFLNFIAVLFAFYLSIRVNNRWLGVLFLLISLLLWYYSSRYKKKYVWGNLLVALLASFIPFSVILYEVPLLRGVYPETLIQPVISRLLQMVGCCAGFLFLDMWIYEINKDLYSQETDREEGITTFPVRLGDRPSRIIIVLLVVAMLIYLILSGLVLFGGKGPGFYYILLALCIPYIIYGIHVFYSKNKFFQLVLLRLLLVLGVGICFFIPYYFNHSLCFWIK